MKSKAARKQAVMDFGTDSHMSCVNPEQKNAAFLHGSERLAWACLIVCECGLNSP